jgi:hypothetical protein
MIHPPLRRRIAPRRFQVEKLVKFWFVKDTIMKKSVFPFVFILALAGALALPAYAGSVVLYDNTTDSSYTGSSYYVSDGQSVTDSFSLSSASTVTGISLGVDLMGGGLDPVNEVDWQITTSAFGGNQVDSGVATAFTETDFPPMMCIGDCGLTVPAQITFGIDDPDLLAGNYWLEIDDLEGTLDGNPSQVNWDVSDGASAANIIDYGSAPSNTFQILGSPDSSTPEPSSLLLLGSGLTALAGLIKRKLTA